MKNAWKRFIAVVVLLVALSPVGARAAVSVYAEDVPNGAVAPTVATNPSTTDGGAAGADHPPVRIDETGVHVGGANPVDINVPDIARGHGDFATRALQNLTGMLAIVGTFGMPVAVIAIVFYFKHRRNKMAHDTLQAMIEKGIPITPELVAEIKSKRSSDSASSRTSNRLLPGLVCAGVGTALLIAGSGGDRRGGWIVLFIGLAFLIVWFVEQKNPNNVQPPR
jgi:hypothetical protein